MEEKTIVVYMAVFFVCDYLITAVLTYRVARRINAGAAWWAFIPFFNVILVAKMSHRGWVFGTFLFIFFSLVPKMSPQGWTAFGQLWPIFLWCGVLAGIILWSMAWSNIAFGAGKPGWYGWLVWVPIVGWVMMWLIGEPKKVKPPVHPAFRQMKEIGDGNYSSLFYREGAGEAYAPDLTQLQWSQGRERPPQAPDGGAGWK